MQLEHQAKRTWEGGGGGGGFIPLTAKRRKRLNGPFGFPFSVLSLKLKGHNESIREWNAVRATYYAPDLSYGAVV